MGKILEIICSQCQNNKNINLFRQCKYPSGTLYYKSICKKCESINQVNRIKKNGLTDLQKEKMKIYKKKYRLLNKNKINLQYKEKFYNNIEFRLRKNISRRISQILKINGGSKNGISVLKFLNYNSKELKIHLEKQFNSKMSWSNYGKYWHIDHIIPQSCLPYSSMQDENFKKCWALENLRPLEAEINMLEGSTRIRHKMFLTKLNGEIDG